ncbi:MAG: class I SAM-dependent methyltransferase [Caldilineaceae bacterium]|nr:class I SAM-dependent methyltransferase [Caldilineaceae bacterium]MBP8109849.1 class I SAM-dependent methyltransferase [Caldilineaceae bacterium]MBP8124558.1 class I SAM-dependent methyltransferase [Caldilineaceae bacterium]MBP9074483.1 class I SAM-dependent methyltransferase [Caldilineaceae bacterium]
MTGTVSDLHGERAALRGNPSFVWRAGQARRLAMILAWAPDRMERALVDGCGTGMYVRALQPHFGQVHGMDIEPEHLRLAVETAPGAGLGLAVCEALPYADASFDLILSHEVLEHVQDDAQSVAEIVRVLRPGGRAVIFVPNRLYPFETHGHYWQGVYHFGNTPLINYLPNPLRNHLAPHVRAYTASGLRHLFHGQPVRILHHTQIYPGYDNIVYRRPSLGKWIRRITYALEQTPLAALGLSHVLVVERVKG